MSLTLLPPVSEEDEAVATSISSFVRRRKVAICRMWAERKGG